MPDASRALRGLVVGGVAAFWLLWSLGVVAQPGFSPARDTTSSLAAYGARLPGLGIAAILSLAVAYAAVALLLGRGGRLRVAAAGLGLAAASTVGIAAARIHCPRGAGGCSGPDGGRTGEPLSDVLHAGFVAVFEVGFVLGVGAAAVGWWVRSGRDPGWRSRPLAAASTVAAVVSPVLLLAQLRAEEGGGAWQIAWVVNGCAWLVLVALLATSRGRPAPAARSRADAAG